MRETIQRTSFATVIYEDRDFACGILDSEGGTVAEAPGLTFFMGSLSPGVKKCLQVIGKENIQPNDIIITTMPEFSGSHPPDMMLFYPIFYEGSLFGFGVSKAHLTDIGAKDPYPTDSTDAFQEGLRMPPVWLYRKGKLNETLASILKVNSRAPEVIWGDIHAQIASFKIAESSIKKLLEKYGFDKVTECIHELYNRSEMIAKAAIEKMPAGSWSVEEFFDDNGVEKGKQVPIKLTITIDKKNCNLIFDFTGSALEQRGPTNCPIISTISMCRLMGKVLTSPDTEANEGSFRPIKVIAPEGTIFNPSSTAPTNLYGWPILSALEGMHKLLAPLFPEIVPACSGGDLCGVLRYGIHPQTGKMFFEANIEGMGQGASARCDGQSALVHYMEACSRNLPVEIEETNDPIIVEKYELLEDSGGPGKYRGGLGVQRDYRMLAPGFMIGVIERGTVPHWGVCGGKPGARNYGLLKSSIHGDIEFLKTPAIPLAEGDLISNRTGGGGGYGDPFERDPEAVLMDVINGYVSLKSAADDYGVVIDPKTKTIDMEATKALRKR